MITKKLKYIIATSFILFHWVIFLYYSIEFLLKFSKLVFTKIFSCDFVYCWYMSGPRSIYHYWRTTISVFPCCQRRARNAALRFECHAMINRSPVSRLPLRCNYDAFCITMVRLRCLPPQPGTSAARAQYPDAEGMLYLV